MAKIVTDLEQIEILEEIIVNAEDFLFLISPYFKLDERLRRLLSGFKSKRRGQLIIVYGKNENDKRKSLSDEDLDFFKSFQNVNIRYLEQLHAKIYLNESMCLTTSLNLHRFSIKNNFEVGLLTESRPLAVFQDIASSFFSSVNQTLDSQAYSAAMTIIQKSVSYFDRGDVEERKLFGLLPGKFENKVFANVSRIGFCIRTKSTIPFNKERPYSAAAFTSWNRYKNPDYKEKYCHQCGKDYATTIAKPICLSCFHS